MIKGLQSYKTPSAPGGAVIQNHGGPVVDKERHKIYRSRVGMLLYLVKHSRPDIAIGVRELSKVLVGPSEAAYKDMLRMVKFVLETKNLVIKLMPVFEFIYGVHRHFHGTSLNVNLANLKMPVAAWFHIAIKASEIG